MDNLDMDNAYAVDVYEMKPVANVCDQILREVGSVLTVVSVAHVIMDEGNVALLHKHTHMSEIYYILEGEGILYNGNQALKVGKDACVVINPGSNHKLKNIGEGQLEHLVFACPPFDPKDIVLYEGEDDESRYEIEKFVSDKMAIEAQDGATVYELLEQDMQDLLQIQLAKGVLPAGRIASKHYHNMSHENYYVMNGEGIVHLGEKLKFKVKKGSYIDVPIDIGHALENTSEDDLEVLCLSTPPFRADDFLKL